MAWPICRHRVVVVDMWWWWLICICMLLSRKRRVDGLSLSSEVMKGNQPSEHTSTHTKTLTHQPEPIPDQPIHPLARKPPQQPPPTALPTTTTLPLLHIRVLSSFDFIPFQQPQAEGEGCLGDGFERQAAHVVVQVDRHAAGPSALLLLSEEWVDQWWGG